MPSRRRRARRHRRSLIALGIVFVILIGAGGVTAIGYSAIKDQAGQLQAQLTVHLAAGQTDLEAAKSSLKQANTTRDESLIAQAKAHFSDAKGQFVAAGQIADASQLLRRLETLPAVGELARSRHTAVKGIADMGVAISDAGQELADLDGNLIKPPTAGGQQGRTLLTVLDQTNTSLVHVRVDLTLAQQAAARVDAGVLPTGQQATFVKARDTISSALSGLDEFERLVPVLTEALGGNGARTFLIEQVNPAELRAGGGFIGTYSVLRADHGTLKVLSSGSSYQLAEPRPLIGQRGYVAPPGPLIESVLQNFSWSFPDSNFFPDFPSNAQAAESFVQPRLGIQIDAVIAMDYYTVAKMLELTGPLALPGFGLTVDSTTFIPEVIRGDIALDARHKALLAAIAGPLMDRVSTLPADRWPALIGALNDLSAARHLQAYFNNGTVEQELVRVGWSGDVNPTTTQDFMMEVESNLGGTKANYFLTRTFTVELTRNGATLHHVVRVDLTDNMPFEYRPNEYYNAYLRLYVGQTASSPSDNLRPVKFSSPAPAAGTRLIDGWVPLFHGYGHSAEAVFEFDTPWKATGRGEAKIYWQKQPGTVTDKLEITWHDGSGHTYTVAGDLAQDRVIRLSTTGVALAPGQLAQAQLPSLSLS